MGDKFCDYCLGALSIQRFNRRLGCGHFICNYCLEFLNKSFGMNLCPFDRRQYNRNLVDLPEDQATRLYIVSPKEMCATHGKTQLYYSKKTYAKLCEMCISKQNISTSDILEEEEFNYYITDKVKQLEAHALYVRDVYESTIQVAEEYEKFENYVKLLRAIKRDLNSTALPNDLIKKLELLNNCKLTEESRSFNEPDFSHFTLPVFQDNFLDYASDMGIEREKKIVGSSSEETVWMGKSLFLLSDIHNNGYYIYRYKIQCPGPVNLIELGLGAEFYKENPANYSSVIVTTVREEIEVSHRLVVSEEKARVTKQFKMYPSIRLYPGDEFQVSVCLDSEKVLCIRNLERNIAFGSKCLHVMDHDQVEESLIIYIRLEDFTP